MAGHRDWHIDCRGGALHEAVSLLPYETIQIWLSIKAGVKISSVDVHDNCTTEVIHLDPLDNLASCWAMSKPLGRLAACYSDYVCPRACLCLLMLAPNPTIEQIFEADIIEP